ncbi:hypothetical protein K7X08_024356 [Anisodus acutangulus]|uniref:Fucosyltransferase n=1 Tax=Anisodus acutangulus TaxID=402998 RepID=A0A9Q1M7N3_9SOLA|nr:hypothetical protein K7X08_024356 [Anisodus acutangulus]
MKRFKKTFNDQQVCFDRAVPKGQELKWDLNPSTLNGFIIVLLIVLTVVFSLAFIFGDLSSDCLWTLAEATIFHVKPSKATVSEEDIPHPLTVPKDKLLGGLLPTGFDETSCLSSGLGNRILTLTSAFLYVLLTNRVLLVDPRVDLPDLFCEPFPEVSWLLPPDFPIIDQFSSFNQKSPHSYGYMMRNNVFLGHSLHSKQPEKGKAVETADSPVRHSVNLNEPIVNSSGKTKTISVLTTSLNPRYFEEIRNIYWENPTVTGEIVSVFQPSHDEHQQTEKLMHDRKAWAEMYLLSLSDKLVTSAWSTSGYVAQGLGRFEAMDFIQV